MFVILSLLLSGCSEPPAGVVSELRGATLGCESMRVGPDGEELPDLWTVDVDATVAEGDWVDVYAETDNASGYADGDWPDTLEAPCESEVTVRLWVSSHDGASMAECLSTSPTATPESWPACGVLE